MNAPTNGNRLWVTSVLTGVGILWVLWVTIMVTDTRGSVVNHASDIQDLKNGTTTPMAKDTRVEIDAIKERLKALELENTLSRRRDSQDGQVKWH